VVGIVFGLLSIPSVGSFLSDLELDGRAKDVDK
jgi:hypothetical protein